MLNYIWDFNPLEAMRNKGFGYFKTFLDACKILKTIALLSLRVYLFLILEDFICNILITNTLHVFLTQRSARTSVLAFALQIN